MSITRLQQARQMYAMGQRVAKTLDGSRPGYRGSDYGDEARGTGGYSGSGGADDRGTPEQNRNQRAQVRAGNVRAIENLIDRPPSVFDRIGTGIKNYVMGGGLLGAGIRGLTGLVDQFTGPKAVDYNDGYNMANIAGPKSYDFGPGPGEGDDYQQLYATTNQYPIMGTIPEEGIATLLNSMPQDPFESRYLQSQPQDIREAIEASMQNYYT